MKNSAAESTNLITEAYTRYHGQVCHYIRYRIEDREEAEDLAQDAFLRLMDYKQIICEETVRHFIFTIARNLVNDYLRRFYKRMEINSYMYDQAETYSNDMESRIMADDIAACERYKAEQLPRQRGIIYRMSRYEEKSVAEISARLNLSQRTVENHLSISRKEMREYMRRCI